MSAGREKKLRWLITDWVIHEKHMSDADIAKDERGIFRWLTAEMDKLEATMAKIAAKEGRHYQPIDRPALLEAERKRQAVLDAEYDVQRAEEKARRGKP